MELTVELVVAGAALLSVLVAYLSLRASGRRERSDRDRAEGALAEWRAGVDRRLDARSGEHDGLKSEVHALTVSVRELIAELRGSGVIARKES